MLLVRLGWVLDFMDLLVSFKMLVASSCRLEQPLLIPDGLRLLQETMDVRDDLFVLLQVQNPNESLNFVSLAIQHRLKTIPRIKISLLSWRVQSRSLQTRCGHGVDHCPASISPLIYKDPSCML